jgi:spermidine synthase
MTQLFRSHEALKRLNAGSLSDKRVKVVNADAFVWVDESAPARADFVVIDFPDPTNFSLGKLYTTAFYRALARHVQPDGIVVVQSTSPLFARQSYWCIVETLRQAGWTPRPYHVYVPSFGEWGYVLASRGEFTMPRSVPDGLRFLTAEGVPQMFDFPRDMARVDAEPNRLNDQVLVRYYDREWSEFSR